MPCLMPINILNVIAQQCSIYSMQYIIITGNNLKLQYITKGILHGCYEKLRSLNLVYSLAINSFSKV